MHVCGIDFDFHKLCIITVFITYQEPIVNKLNASNFSYSFILKSQIIFFLKKTHYIKQIVWILYLPSITRVAFPFFSSPVRELITLFSYCSHIYLSRQYYRN